MDLDSDQQAWKADVPQGNVAVDVDVLRKEVLRDQHNFRTKISWRDFGEVGVTLLLLPLWFYLGAVTSSPWTWYLTVPVLVWIAGFTLLYRKRHRQKPSEPDDPLLQCVKSSVTEVEAQIWLLRNIAWWYLLPPAISIMAFFVHTSWQSSSVWWEFLVTVTGAGLFLVVLYGSIYFWNQRAVRMQLEPRRQKLLKLIAHLEDKTTSEDLHDVSDLVSALADPVQNCSWAQNWNLMIPSWRAATTITLATLGGAFCGWWVPTDDLGPAFFRAVVGAVVAFEIALGCAWLYFRKQQDQSPSANSEPKALAAGVDPDNSSSQKPQPLPGTPAQTIIGLTLFLSIMAVLMLFLNLMGKGGDSWIGAVAAPQEPEFDDVSDISRVDAWLQQQVELCKYPSLSVAVVRDGEFVYQRAFGFEDIKAARQATPQTQYHVASVTKAFTASLAVMLHDRGVVDLDQPVVKYLPADVSISTTSEIGATITLRQLASHTSGLPRGVPGRVQSVDGWYQLEPQRLYDHLANVNLNYDPGTEEEYSNLGFGLLGHTLECAAEQPLDRMLQQMICDPLQLPQTAIPVDDSLHAATGYDSSSWRFAREHSVRERLAGSGGLVASVEDLAKFLAAQMKPGVFSSEMLGQLHTASVLADGNRARTALGWAVRSNVYVGPILKKNGGRSNCDAWIGFAPQFGVGVAVVTNCGGPDVDPIGYWLLERSVAGAHRPVGKFGYARVAPYTGVRWENDLPIVHVQNKWSPLASIDGIPVDRIMQFAHKEFGDRARQRFAEDLVRVMSEMGHEPEWKVTLGLQTSDGQVENLQIRMTEENRDLVRK